MPFFELQLKLDGIDPASAEQACFDSGALAVTLADAGDTPILEPAPGATPLWPSIRLAALYAADADTDRVAHSVAAALGRPADTLEFRTVADRVWEREWLKDFRPMQFGRRLWVCPGGQRPPVTTADTVILELDPGLAFGTGTHATTALCLDWLDRIELAGRRVLDVGCGSGILAIAALRLGAASALAVDIDPQALTATRDNAARNAVEGRLEIRDAARDWGQGHGVILANILAEPLIELAPRIAAASAADADIALSGILVAQAPPVAAAFATWFDMRLQDQRDGWACLSGTRLRS
jgi:ribosomal protein L11 methyltransferase